MNEPLNGEVVNKDDIRIRVSVKVETGAGETIVEFAQEKVVQEILANGGLETAVSDFENAICTLFVYPVRAMFRAKVLALQKLKGFARIRFPGLPGVARIPHWHDEQLDMYMTEVRKLAQIMSKKTS